MLEYTTHAKLPVLQVVAHLFFLAVAGCATELPFGLGSNEASQTQGAGLAPAPVANRFVGTQHPSALGPLRWQVNSKTPESALSKIVVTPEDQINQAKQIFDIGPSAYMIDYEGKVNDIAAMAKLVEYASPGLNLYDEQYKTLHEPLFAAIETKVSSGTPEERKTFANFPLTRNEWQHEYTQKSSTGYRLGWRAGDFRDGVYFEAADEPNHREIYVRLPDKDSKGGIPRQSVIQEIARINFLYINYLHKLLLGPDAELHNAIVRLIEPQTTTIEAIEEINKAYDEACETIASLYSTSQNSSPTFLMTYSDEQVLPAFPVQAVALLEDPQSIIMGADWVKQYITFFIERYKFEPPSVILFFAGSDLNRIVGSVAGELLRSVMINRLHKLQNAYPDIHIIAWLGSGSGPARSGPGALENGHYMEYDANTNTHALLNTGIPRTFQPDGLEAASNFTPTEFPKQPSDADIKTIYTAAELLVSEGSIPGLFDAQKESARMLWSGITMFAHIDRINRYAWPLYSLKTLLESHDQVGRVKSGGGSGAYGRDWPDVTGYLEQVLNSKDQGFDPNAFSPANPQIGTNAQASLNALLRTLQLRLNVVGGWIGGTKSTRAINDAFGRYILGTPLTTVHGIGATLRLLNKVPGEFQICTTREHNTVEFVNSQLKLLEGDLEAQNPALRPQPGKVQVDQLIAILRRELGFDEPLADKLGTINYEKIPQEIHALWRYYIRNEGFAIIHKSPNDSDTNEDIAASQLIKKRIEVVFPKGKTNVTTTIDKLREFAPQLKVTNYDSFVTYLVNEYTRDVLALESYVENTYGGKGCKLYDSCSGIDLTQAKQYRIALNRLLEDADFQKAMHGQGLTEIAWKTLFKDKIIPLLELPGWKRIG